MWWAHVVSTCCTYVCPYSLWDFMSHVVSRLLYWKASTGRGGLMLLLQSTGNGVSTEKKLWVEFYICVVCLYSSYKHVSNCAHVHVCHGHVMWVCLCLNRIGVYFILTFFSLQIGKKARSLSERSAGKSCSDLCEFCFSTVDLLIYSSWFMSCYFKNNNKTRIWEVQVQNLATKCTRNNVRSLINIKLDHLCALLL